MSTPMIILDRV